jgi:hypothetical protein
LDPFIKGLHCGQDIWMHVSTTNTSSPQQPFKHWINEN